MWNVDSSLGKYFLVSGLIPAMLFLGAVDLLFAPRYLEGRHLVEFDFLGIPGVVYILGGAFLGLLLLALNTAIIKLYEHGFYLAGWLRQRNLAQHSERYTALLSRRRAYEQAQETDTGLDQAIATLEAVHEKLETLQSGQSLPHDPRYIKPTALGNAFAIMEEYPYQRYGMDAMVFWPRLSGVISEDYQGLIGDLKTTLDFLLNLSILALLFAAGALGSALLNLSLAEAAGGFLGLLAAYGLYRGAVNATAEMGEAVMSCFDLYRGALLERYGLNQPESLIAEKHTWMLLASFIRRGEPFYFPLELPLENDRALLQQALSRHTHNLYKLKSQAAMYGAGEQPLYLLNQIEAEEQAIAEQRALLSAIEPVARDPAR